MKHGDGVLDNGSFSPYIFSSTRRPRRGVIKLRVDHKDDPPSLTFVAVTALLAGGVWTELCRAILTGGWP